MTTSLSRICLIGSVRRCVYRRYGRTKDTVWNAAPLEAIKASTTIMDECDVVVQETKSLNSSTIPTVSRQLNIRIPSFGHAGDGNLHVYICKDDLDDETWKRSWTKLRFTIQ